MYKYNILRFNLILQVIYDGNVGLFAGNCVECLVGELIGSFVGEYLILLLALNKSFLLLICILSL